MTIISNQLDYVHATELEEELTKAIETLQWAQYRGLKMKDKHINKLIDFQDEIHVARMRYDVKRLKEHNRTAKA